MPGTQNSRPFYPWTDRRLGWKAPLKTAILVSLWVVGSANLCLLLHWLALAWIGFHVILSAFHTLTELAIHSLFFGILAFLLFRPASTHFFQGGKAKEA